MKNRLTDIELLDELKLRFESNIRMIQEQKNLTQQLQEVNLKLLASEQLKTNFLSNIRNEINNPIASILELAKNISGTEMDKATITKLASYLFNEVFVLDFQLRNIFVSAELEAGESQLSVSKVTVFTFINNFKDHYNHLLIKKNIKFELHNNIDERQTFFTDPEKLFLILSNLMFNAIQFSPFGSKIEMDCDIDNDVLIISLRDYGIGIDAENHKKIFDRFLQLDSGSSKLYPGHGLGLSITASLLELLDGELFVESELNKGSRFTIKLNQLSGAGFSTGISSSDGNEFLFNCPDEKTF